jgi:predicted NBD/HSP70 family sugar kinase
MSDDGAVAGPRAVAVAPSVLRAMNQRLLLDRLFAAGPATRPQLARDAGLSLPTVIAALSGLEEAGLVRTAGRPETAAGRPAALYEANPAAGHVVGIDIGRAWLHVVVSDLAGTHLAAVDVKNSARTAPALVELVGKSANRAALAASLDAHEITHTVIGSPGVYDPRRGRVLYAANLPGWQRAGLAEALANRLGTSLTVDNDANLAAIGEHNYGAGQGCAHFVYAHIGTGVGLGIVLNGELYRGATGAAGEAGYLPIGSALPAPSIGRPQRGQLEESLAADAVVRYAVQAGMEPSVSAEDVFRAAAEGDRRAGRALRTEARHLARLLASIMASYDPELIVLGGGVGQNLELLKPETFAALERLTPMQPRLAVSRLGNEAVVRGAIAAGLQRARTDVFSSAIEHAG